jgi:hypothetical protein
MGMKWIIVVIFLVLLFILGFVYVSNAASDNEYEFLGRLSFVKISNPDIYQGSPHSRLAAEYAKERGSNTVLILHFAGHTGGQSYPNYLEGDVLVLELGFQDGATDYKLNNSVDWLVHSSFTMFLFGVPSDRFRYVSNGHVFYNLGDALIYLDQVAAQYGQEGKIVVVYHGTARGGNPNIMLGDGVPLYFQMVWLKHGRLAAYYYLLSGMLFPYYNSPYASYELFNAEHLQELYNDRGLNLKTAPYSYYELRNYTG